MQDYKDCAIMSNFGRKGGKSKRKEFLWSDDETELLLNVINDYKTSKVGENVDWQSVQSKYSDILNLFQEQYPCKDKS